MSSHKALSLGCRLVFPRMREPHPWQRGLGAILTSALFLLGCWGLSDFQQVGESAGVEVFGEPWGRESELLWVLKESALGREGTAWGLLSALGFAPGQGADLSVGFWGWSVLTEEGMGFSILCPPPPTPPPRLPLPLALPLCHPLLPLFSLVLSVLQQFLQALEPEEVTSYFGPEATLKGTCRGVFLAGGSQGQGSVGGRKPKNLPSFLLINSGLLPSP